MRATTRLAILVLLLGTAACAGSTAPSAPLTPPADEQGAPCTTVPGVQGADALIEAC